MTTTRERYDTMVGQWWLILYGAIAFVLLVVGLLLPDYVRSHAGVFLVLIFLGPPVLPYFFIPPFRVWRALRRRSVLKVLRP